MGNFNQRDFSNRRGQLRTEEACNTFRNKSMTIAMLIVAEFDCIQV